MVAQPIAQLAQAQAVDAALLQVVLQDAPPDLAVPLVVLARLVPITQFVQVEPALEQVAQPLAERIAVQRPRLAALWSLLALDALAVPGVGTLGPRTGLLGGRRQGQQREGEKGEGGARHGRRLLCRFSWDAPWNRGIGTGFREEEADTHSMRFARKALPAVAGLAVLAALALGGYVRTGKAYRERIDALVALSIPPSSVRRPWEPRLEAMSTRLMAQRDFPPEGPRPCSAWREARDLDAEERAWLDAATAQLDGLERVLAALRELDPGDLAWNGETSKLLFTRACTNVLTGHAWQSHDPAPLFDALRLLRATDDGTTIGSLVRTTSEQIVLECVHAGVASGRFEARTLLAGARPLLDDWTFSPERAERRLRRDLSQIGHLVHAEGLELAGPRDRALRQREILSFLEPVEQAFEIARLPAHQTPWVVEEGRAALLGGDTSPRPLSVWCTATAQAHGRHAGRNVLLTGLAVVAFHEANGRWPRRLGEVEELPEEDALDPVTGRGLAYSLDAESVTIGPAGWGVLGDPRPDAFASPYGWRLP